MPDLSPAAVEHLWPVLQIVGAMVFVLASFVIGLWRGFRWLQGQIRATAEAMVGPVSETALTAKRAAIKANRRLDKLRSELNLEPDPWDLDTKP